MLLKKKGITGVPAVWELQEIFNLTKKNTKDNQHVIQGALIRFFVDIFAGRQLQNRPAKLYIKRKSMRGWYNAIF